MAHDDIKKMIISRRDEIDQFINDTVREADHLQERRQSLLDQRDRAQADADLLDKALNALNSDLAVAQTPMTAAEKLQGLGLSEPTKPYYPE